jgi:WD40 repeat protein
VLADSGETGLWDAVTGTQVAALPAFSFGLAFDPDSRLLLTSDTSRMGLWDITSGAQLQRFATSLPVAGIALSPDGSTLFAATSEIMGSENQQCEFVVFDVSTGQTLRQFEIGADEVDSMGCVLWANPVFSPDGRTVFAGVDERIIAWDVSTGSRVQTFNGHSASVIAIAPSPDGRTVLSSDLNGQIIFWDVATAQEIRRQNGYIPVFAADGHTALVSRADGSVILWDLNADAEIRQFEAAQGDISSLRISPDGQAVVACNSNGQILAWSISSGRLDHRLMTPGGCQQAFFTLDDQYILTDGAALWSLASGEIIRQYPYGWDMVLSPDGRSFFSTTGELRSPEIFQYRIDSLDQLITWTLDHRVVREPDCHERVLYQLEPRCDDAGTFPTRTPYPTAYHPTVTRTSIPAGNLAITVTITPSVTPHPILIGHLGKDRGEVPVGGEQVWQYAGQAGEMLTIQAKADFPVNGADQTTLSPGMLDTLVIVTAPDGRDLNVYNSGGGVFYRPSQSDDIEAGIKTDSLVDRLVLPVSGTYQIIVSGSGYRTGGAYTLIIESIPPGSPTPEITPVEVS